MPREGVSNSLKFLKNTQFVQILQALSGVSGMTCGMGRREGEKPLTLDSFFNRRLRKGGRKTEMGTWDGNGFHHLEKEHHGTC